MAVKGLTFSVLFSQLPQPVDTHYLIGEAWNLLDRLFCLRTTRVGNCFDFSKRNFVPGKT